MNSPRNLWKLLPLTALPLFALGCSSTQPPRELIDARAAYARAQADARVTSLAPTQLHVAKTTLDTAERHFRDEGDEPETRDLAYIAERRARYAEVQAGLLTAQRQKAEAVTESQRRLAMSAQQSQSDLRQTKSQLDQEKARRQQAELRAKEAMDSLARIAAIKQEDRGMVITLSGSVLFASGKWTLLPSASSRLEEVARALKEQEGRNITIEGHTDSVGNDASNMTLSQKRADSVREFLVSRGVPADRVRSVGVGEGRPVADNQSTEGRANNRRVEIIIEASRETGGNQPAGTLGSGIQPSSTGSGSGTTTQPNR
ncbi:MAG TPA: OmpA family protein [Polyangiaceae bacterium]|nr:OmpA family protein [Polyangiaceae bacterium]